jgi:hypothetical protein
MRLIDHLQRGDAYWATRSVDEFHLGRQHIINPIFNDGVRLTPADLHEHPRLGDDPTNLSKYFLSERFVAIFIEIFHMRP